MAITPSGSCSAVLLKKLGMPVFDYSHLDDCAGYIAEVLEGTIELPPMPHDKVQYYSAPDVAERFVNMVRELTVRT